MTFLEKASALVNAEDPRDDSGKSIGLKLIEVARETPAVALRKYTDHFWLFPTEEHFDPSEYLVESAGDDSEVRLVVFEYIDRGVWDWFAFAKFLARFPKLEVLHVGQNYCHDEDGFEEFLVGTTLKLIVFDDLQSKMFHDMPDHHKLELIVEHLTDCTIFVFEPCSTHMGVKYKFDKHGFVKTVRYHPPEDEPGFAL